jgi:anti-sigma factor ChrR (cupin superfamily)
MVGYVDQGALRREMEEIILTRPPYGPTFPATILERLFDLDYIYKLPWKPLRSGVEIHSLYGNLESGPSAALLYYAPGGVIPLHVHQGYEHIYVLSGYQSDESGQYAAGSFVVNPPGSRHTVTCPAGGIALVIWEKPVTFIQPE